MASMTKVFLFKEEETFLNGEYFLLERYFMGKEFPIISGFTEKTKYLF